MTKTMAIRIHETGGPDKMRWEEVELPALKPNDILIRHEAVGLNFIDTYHRSGIYPLPLPAILGVEGAGEVEQVGNDVKDIAIGDRVGYVGDPGSYAERRIIAADRVVKLPKGIDSKMAAALLSKGMTVEYLVQRTYPVKKGDKILLHAAAGGVGSIAAQWLKAIGALVIGTVGSATKIERAKAQGCDFVIDYSQANWVEEVRKCTNGQGVDAVFDGVGKDTFMGSLDCLRPRGMMVTFGNASGPVPAIEPLLLARKGSLFLTRPTLSHYIATKEEFTQSAESLFMMIKKGAVKIDIGAQYPLAEAAKAHQDLQDRKILGSALLLP